MINLLISIEQIDPHFKPDVMELFEEFSDMVYRISLVRVNQSTDADDIYQEVFLRLVKHVSKLRSREHAKAWLIRCTINCCNSHHSSLWKTRTTRLEQYHDFGKIELGYEQIELLGAVRALTPEHQDVIHMYYYEGYPVKEIADFLGVNESTVRSRLHRARYELRSVFGEEDNTDGTE